MAASERLLLTRPLDPEDRLALPEQAWSLPLLQLQPAAATPALRQALVAGASANLQICLSAHAARALVKLDPGYVERGARSGAQAPRWLAIGEASKRALQQYQGVTADCPPAAQSDSEGLLSMVGAVDGKSVAILTAPEGREWLAEALRERGARVWQLELYLRSPREPSAAELAQLQQWPHPLLYSATSVALLEQLLLLLNRLGRNPADCALVVSAPRIAEVARTKGFSDVRLARSAAVSELLTCLR